MPNSKYKKPYEEEKLNPYNPANALIRQNASDVVNSWATPQQPTTQGTTPTKPTLSQEAINSYTNKVQSLYDYENQQRASVDANFQKSLKYLPQQFKQAGLYGSGQSESTLVEMNNAQLNRQNEISAKTNKGIMELQEKYNDDVENLDEQTKLQVDEVANFISERDWSNASKQDWDNFINYLKSADYSDDVINKAIEQIKAFNPDVGNQLSNYKGISEGTSQEFTQEDINNQKNVSAILPRGKGKVRAWDSIQVTYNGKTYTIGAHTVVDTNMDKKLDDFARILGVENKAGAIVYYQGKLYIQSGQEKGWRKVGNTDANEAHRTGSYKELMDNFN